MNKQLLNKYFKDQCTNTEKEVVEEWILNQKNKSTFENYVEEQWNDFEIDPKHLKSSTTYAIRKSTMWKAAATFMIFTSVGAYTYLNSSNVQKNTTDNKEILAKANQSQELKPLSQLENKVVIEDKPSQVTKKKSAQNTKKQALLATKDSILNSVKPESKRITASRIGHLAFNEKLLSELSSQIDSNKLVLTMNMKEERFLEIAELLKSKYQIILEPIKTGGEKNMYAARFERTNIPELLKLMEDRMAFTYNLRDSILQINL